MSNNYLLSLIAIAMGFVAVVMLHRNWRQRKTVKSVLVNWLPWLLLVGSIILWILDTGIEFGVVYALLGFTLVVWIVIAIFHRKQIGQYSKAKVDDQQRIKQHWSGKLFLRNSGLLFVIVPVACFSSVTICLGLMPLVPASEATQLVTVGFLFPVIWSALTLWCCSEEKRWRPAIIMITVAGVAAVISQV